MESQRKALIAANVALEKQAGAVEVLDVRALSSVTDFFVIGTAESHRQLVAIVEAIEAQFAQVGERIWHVEGLAPLGAQDIGQRNGLSWALMDCGDLVIHVFSPLARTFYQLEHLWADAPRIPFASPPSPV